MVYERHHLSASPILVLPPPPSHSFRLDSTKNPFSNASTNNQDFSHPQSQGTSITSRKRSRDESNLEDDGFLESPAPVPEPSSEDGWEYGEGMILVRPNGFIIDASSQTGTWADEKIATPPSVTPNDRPVLRTFKSQRLDLTATPAIEEEITLANGTMAAHNPPKSSIEPTVDDYTIHLGIGWRRLSADEDIQAAARGWAKYIEKHFPVSKPEIKLQSRGLSSYLVETREGWFLFGDDLRQGRLVSTSLNKTFENLRNQPPFFDGSIVLEAQVSTPEADFTQETHMDVDERQGLSNALDGSQSTNVVTETVGRIAEVEMDMS